MRKEKLVSKWKNDISDKVLSAFDDIPREEFVTKKMRSKAYEDRPLPILRGKTISQPTTVITMTEELDLEEGNNVLEVGTGSGYQTALIASIVEPGKVITTEVIPELIDFARDNLDNVDLDNIKIVEKDGSQGYEKEAPYDRIIITAACPKIPQVLIDQLKEGGILIGPEGSLESQRMVKIKKLRSGIKKEFLGNFVFSPLAGKNGFSEEELIEY